MHDFLLSQELLSQGVAVDATVDALLHTHDQVFAHPSLNDAGQLIQVDTATEAK
jgi:hypothetical protein